MAQGDSHGLSTLEPITARVAMWRRRHRARVAHVTAYQVVYDGACIADIEARTTQALDDEIASAAWELAQSIGRPVTADVIAVDGAGVELARMPMRVLPVAPSVPQSMDATQITATLVNANQQLMRLVVDVLGAVTEQQKTFAQITTELARSSGRRAVAAEQEAAEATATAMEAVHAIREAGAAQSRTIGDRGLDLVEGFLKERLGLASAPTSELPSGEHAAASAEGA